MRDGIEKMRLEKLISELQNIKDQRGGDIEVYRGDSEWYSIKIYNVSVESGDPGEGTVVVLD